MRLRLPLLSETMVQRNRVQVSVCELEPDNRILQHQDRNTRHFKTRPSVTTGTISAATTLPVCVCVCRLTYFSYDSEEQKRQYNQTVAIVYVEEKADCGANHRTG